MTFAEVVTAFVTLFVIVEPVSIAPLFAALTRGMSNTRRRAIALRASLVAFGILTAFGLAGDAILGFLGITIPAFRISGGLLLFLTALDMLFDRRTARREGQATAQEEDHDPSVFPLAMPLLAGPGAITTMILLKGKVAGALAVVELHAVLAAVIVLAFLMFQLAGPLDRVLGRTGNNVINRLAGMLLAALSVQFVIDGIAAAGLLTH